MAKIGDTVRFLSTTGGGVITKIDGRIAYVEEDGFETPVLLSEVVVVLPAGHEPANKGARMMFDQKAYDEGKKEVREKPVQNVTDVPEPEPELPVEETEYGDDIVTALVFEPENVKSLSTSKINLALVNDSNYFLFFSLLVRDNDSKAWKSLYTGEVAPNEMIDLASFKQENISDIERVVFQATAYKKGKSFQVKYPINVSKKIDLTKFFKAHCFRPGIYLDAPSIEIPLYSERRK